MESIDIENLIAQIRGLLPVQAPLSSFIHNNILQPFEKFQFDEGLRQAQDVYHSKAYMNESFYLKAIEEGKITDEDIYQSLLEKFSDSHLQSKSCLDKLTNLDFYKIILKDPPEFVPRSNLDWRLSHDILFDQTRPSTAYIPKIAQSTRRGIEHLTQSELFSFLEDLSSTAELDHFTRNLIESLILKIKSGRSLPHLNDKFCLNLLWASCLFVSKKSIKTLTSPQTRFLTYRCKRFFQFHYNDNIDDYIYPFVVHFLANYLDQGMSYWPSPMTEEGLWKQFSTYFLSETRIFPAWANYAQYWVKDYTKDGFSSKQIIQAELKKSNLPLENQSDYLKELALDLRGWTGLVNKMETEPHLAPVKAPKCNLEDFLAIRLIIERAIVLHLSHKHQVSHFNSLQEVSKVSMNHLENAYTLFQIFLATGWNSLDVTLSDKINFDLFYKELESFDKDTRKMILHHAYEKHFYCYALNRIKNKKSIPPTHIERQVFFCIDDREESMRRHLEETDKKVQTFGVVGFYMIDMMFVSALHPRKTPHCPIVITPRRVIKEIPKETHKEVLRKIKSKHKFLSQLLLLNYYSSRTMIRGFFNSLIMGSMSPFLLFLKTFIPQPINKLKNLSKKAFKIDFATELTIESNPKEDPKVGYNIDEMAEMVSTLLKSSGLIKDFAPLVVFLGHGSNSVNNFHLNAYGCGACGGKPGAPNARAFAQMINRKDVKDKLKENFQILIPSETHFVGGFHDTCNDEIIFFDTDVIPATVISNFLEFRTNLNRATKLNAQERSRYFKNANPSMNLEEAYSHVHERALDLSEPRAEYGHTKVAMCVIGRRELTKGLNLEKRSFLVSYDPLIDNDKGDILKGVLLNSIPVCAGISLDYFFSFIDSEKFGSGSKLPLNLTSLIGVVSGSSGDIRLGLPRQGIDQHEPIRLLTMIEADENILMNIIQNHPRLKALVFNHWIKLAVISPKDHSIKIFVKDKLEVYQGILS